METKNRLVFVVSWELADKASVAVAAGGYDWFSHVDAAKVCYHDQVELYEKTHTIRITPMAVPDGTHELIIDFIDTHLVDVENSTEPLYEHSPDKTDSYFSGN